MNVLLKAATIVDKESKHHLKKRDVLIEKGIIKKIAASISLDKKIKEISLDNLHISRGWFDSGVSFGEPGFEERGTIENGLKVAAYSGFTDVAIHTNTAPVPDNKGAINFLKANATSNAVNIHPLGCLTRQCNGEDLAELYDMTGTGVTSFYDYKQPILNPNLLKIALQYVQNFGGIVQSFPLEKAISPKGIVHEDINSTRLGLKGIPSLAEALQVARDLYILEYTGGTLHIPTISTKESVGLIKEAKKKGLNITCSVSINNLALTDDKLESFDTNYKVMPPLRTNEDVKALLKGLKEGTVDMVTSDHNPIDIEHKKIEFDHAMFGSIGLESCFGALNSLTDLETTINALTKNEIFNLPSREISEENIATLTLFNPTGTWKFNTNNIKSTSSNAAMIGQRLKGKVYGILSNNKLVLN
ncbi:dihydroorotase [Patiriisocius marinistellae]|uniref:Dihydroorotase n=1 Tax=Patiriisocius marinistellae TaxID=2494560 RepID=A0A5J4G2P3_9FLAO|nr:dihydroorotase [Patiriisocius marinistellae]GEQ86481.1 dihydroorotase [Patiriisocius marinistellae]